MPCHVYIFYRTNKYIYLIAIPVLLCFDCPYATTYTAHNQTIIINVPNIYIRVYQCRNSYMSKGRDRLGPVMGFFSSKLLAKFWSSNICQLHVAKLIILGSNCDVFVPDPAECCSGAERNYNVHHSYDAIIIIYICINKLLNSIKTNTL